MDLHIVEKILENISYNRLSSYWYPFLAEPKKDEIFKENIDFELIFKTYQFDSEFRLLMFYAIEQIEIALSQIKHFLQVTGEREISSRIIGEEVMSQLHELDEVAYIRFASVYRSFQDLNEFQDELNRLSSAKPMPVKK